MKYDWKPVFFSLLVGSTAFIGHAQQALKSENNYSAKTALFSPMVQQEGMSLHIQFENPGNENVQIIFRSTDGDEWSRELKSSNIDKHYDLSHLEDGEYDLNILKGKQLVRRKIILVTDYQLTRQVIF